jgi:ATP-dependent Clp protease adaptor protein ClpS
MSQEKNAGFDTSEKINDKLKEPEDYQVLLLNDDYTSMDFVIAVLIAIFHKSQDEAIEIMQYIHKNGKGLVGIYSRDIAFTKADQVHSWAKMEEFPLRCRVEKI